MAGCPTVDLELVQTTRNVNGTRLPFGNSNRENGTTFLDFPLFLGIFQWDEPAKRVPFTSQPEIPEILTKWKAPVVAKLSFPFPSPPQERPGELARRLMEVQRYRSNPPSWDSFFFSMHSALVKCQTKIILFGVNWRLELAGLGKKRKKGARQTRFLSKATSVPNAN